MLLPVKLLKAPEWQQPALHFSHSFQTWVRCRLSHSHLQGRKQLRQELLERQQQLQHPVPRLIGLSSQLCLLDVPQVPTISGSNAQVSRHS